MRRVILVLFAAVPILLGIGGTVPRPHDTLLSRLRTQPVVAIDPTNPSVIVAGGNTNYLAQPDGTYPAPYFTSHDGGKTFNTGTLPLPASYSTGADASIAIAQDGTVFYSYLAESPTYCTGGSAAIVLAHSIDHGLSFRGPVIVDSNPADEYPSLAVESIPNHPSHLFLAWTRTYQNHSEVWVARSVDGGATFSPASMLYSSALDNIGAQPVVGPHQQVYVVWLTRHNVAPTAVSVAQVLLAASSDDGARYGPVRGAGPGFTTLPLLAQPGSLRDLTAPAAAAAPSGALYVAYAAVRDHHADGSVDADIWLRRSLDEGATWSAPRRLNDVRRGDRFMPSLSVLGDGTLGVAFYDRRAGTGELDVFAVRASFAHGFKVSRNIQVNTAPSPIADISALQGTSVAASCFPSGRFVGDYLGTAAGGTTLSVAWSSPQGQVKNETDLWFAQVPMPAFAVHHATVSAPPAVATSWWSRITGAPGAFQAWLGGIASHSPLWGLSTWQLLLVLGVLLLPLLAIATAFMSVRQSRGW